MSENNTMSVFVVVAPSGDVFSSQVTAQTADEALYKCANISRCPQIRKAQAKQMEKEGWQVYSKLKWDYLNSERMK
jgi:hypothetical protein